MASRTMNRNREPLDLWKALVVESTWNYEHKGVSTGTRNQHFHWYALGLLNWYPPGLLNQAWLQKPSSPTRHPTLGSDGMRFTEIRSQQGSGGPHRRWHFGKTWTSWRLNLESFGITAWCRGKLGRNVGFRHCAVTLPGASGAATLRRSGGRVALRRCRWASDAATLPLGQWRCDAVGAATLRRCDAGATLRRCWCCDAATDAATLRRCDAGAKLRRC